MKSLGPSYYHYADDPRDSFLRTPSHSMPPTTSRDCIAIALNCPRASRILAKEMLEILDQFTMQDFTYKVIQEMSHRE